jgi:cysteine desulfurase/selenocysteine lyase
MCGPSGVGILFGKMKHLEKMTPMRLGGGTVSSVEKNLKINYSPIPHRFEGGTPNTEGILATYSAIKFLQKIGMENVEKHEIELKKYFDKKIKDIKNIDYASKDSLFPVIALNYKGINPQDFANYFGKNKIIVRGGTACVKLAYMFTGNKSGYVRISLYIYNDFSDIDKIINVIKKFKPSKILEKII